MLDDVQVAIVGTGFAGLGLAIRLMREGIRDLVLLERADDVGGTWRDNTYPGAACDIQSHLYSYSFRPNPHWSRTYASQPEIHAYLREAAWDEGVMPKIRFGAEVLAAGWDEDQKVWSVQTPRGHVRAQFLVAATGHLSDPRLPDIPGLDRFEGTIFHSARWDHSQSLDCLRVGVVGTGASAIQIVPAIAERTGHLTVFQRTAPHVIPRFDEEFSDADRRLFARMPDVARDLRNRLFWGNESRYPQRRMVPEFLEEIEALADGHRRAQVSDPELLAKITPDYTIGCKRVLLSNDWYPALCRDDVTLETSGITSVTPSGVTLTGGQHLELDALVLSTGFEATDLPIAHRLTGRDGVLLADQWSTGGQAFASVAVHNFPNLFLMNGPNSGLGAGSVVYIIESQIDYLHGAIAHGLEHEVILEVSAEAEEEYVRSVRERAEGTVWLSGGCASWYVDPRSGNLTTLWPDMMHRYRAKNARFVAAPYRTVPASPAREPVRL
ncbi:NAD(P)/FAD-dependent oxidoreductase [Ruania alkalisoli]|uniref:NAD(P)/FAD-dependent oxidoreductase n=2 Tax=Ruania alkalisoli TaxID=2779775 RepID=A0A7M1SYG8_9MICO|nr:NAD(P)/FAD-dependent oxidoreductase [Ruania alkalisoli]